jgi:hypothetical protein
LEVTLLLLAKKNGGEFVMLEFGLTGVLALTTLRAE